MKDRCVVGLRSATPTEIVELKKDLQRKWKFVTHRTHRQDGAALPFNGVLICKNKR